VNIFSRDIEGALSRNCAQVKLPKRTARYFEFHSSGADAIRYEQTEASNERIDKIFTRAPAMGERMKVREEKSIAMLRSYFNVNRRRV
jgi:hypothetical protein